MYEYDYYRKMQEMQEMQNMQNMQNMQGMMNVPNMQGIASTPNMQGMMGASNIPGMYMTGMPQSYYPMVYMPEKQMEEMYPKMYHMVNNAVENQCDMMEMKYGPNHMPSKDEMDSMVEDIHKDVGPKVEEMEEYKEKKDSERQFGFGGRRIFRDLIRILLIRELLRRRQHHGHGMFGY